MVSDVLADAVAAIGDYQRSFPDRYADFPELRIVVEFMDALRAVLDLSPSSPEFSEPHRQRLLSTIREGGDIADRLHEAMATLIDEARRARAVNAFQQQPTADRADGDRTTRH